MQNNKFVITGGPGFGKTSIINELEKRGYHSIHEISRSIIKEQLAIGGDILPWKNLNTFSRIIFERRLVQFNDAPDHNLCFFDRGIPDVVAYMSKGDLELPDLYARALKDYSYNQLIFLTPPWESIFVNDSERMENFKEAVDAHQFIEKTYNDLGYQTIEIPMISVEERAEFILDKIKMQAS